MRKIVLGLLSALAFSAVPAFASQTIVAYEIDNFFVFTGNGGPGSTITVTAILVNPANHSQQIGTKQEWCQISGYNSLGHPVLWCDEHLSFPALKGSLNAQGYFDETLFEAGVAQSIPIIGGGGVWAGKIGVETLKQIVFPNEILNTLVIN